VTHVYRLLVPGPVSRGLARAVADRFAGATVRGAGEDTVVELPGADQPALRALLTLLWDAGHDVHEVGCAAGHCPPP
jgi:hypothetical protein